MKIIMAVLQFQMLGSLNQIFSFLFQNLGLCRLVALSKAQTDRYLSPNSQCERQKVEVAQLCLTLWDPMDYSLPASSVHGILQARILEWVATPFSRGSSCPGIEPGFPALQADSLPCEPLGNTWPSKRHQGPWLPVATQVHAQALDYSQPQSLGSSAGRASDF